MINQIGGFEDIIEKGQSAAQNIGKSTKQGATNFVKATTGQVTGSQPQGSSSAQGTNEQGSANQTKQMSDDDAKQFLKDLYGASDKNSSPQKGTAQANPTQNPIQNALGIPQKDPNAGKTPEELAKLEALRQQLHADYYRNLTRSQKPSEEHVSEKLEREEKQAQFEDLERDKKKPPPLPATVKQGTGESVVGVSG